MTKTTDDLLSAVKRTVTFPSSQARFSDGDILAFANEEMSAKLVPCLLSLRQEFFLRVERTVLINGVDTYDIPYRSIGRTFQDLKLFDGVQTRRMARLQTNDVHLFSYNAQPHSFYFRGDQYVVVPVPVVSQSLWAETWYFFRPGQLVSTSAASTITAVSGDVVTLTAVPSNITSGSKVDVIRGTSGCMTLVYDCVVQNIAGNVVTLATGSLTQAVPPAPVPTVNPGDWMSSADTSPVIQLPDECFEYFMHRVAMRVLDAQGDYDGKQSLAQIFPQLEKDMEMILAPRIVNEVQKIIQRNGLLRGSRTRYRRGLVY